MISTNTHSPKSNPFYTVNRSNKCNFFSHFVLLLIIGVQFGINNVHDLNVRSLYNFTCTEKNYSHLIVLNFHKIFLK